MRSIRTDGCPSAGMKAVRAELVVELLLMG
jgi:hypothetical protein